MYARAAHDAILSEAGLPHRGLEHLNSIGVQPPHQALSTLLLLSHMRRKDTPIPSSPGIHQIKLGTVHVSGLITSNHEEFPLPSTTGSPAVSGASLLGALLKKRFQRQAMR